MKKILLFLCFMFLTLGCGKIKTKDLINDLSKKIEKNENYQLTATLEIFRGEDKYIYDVISTFQKGEYFKVDLINTQNNHQQIILKDSESVYVLTPSLNKSFKFQSDWPYNNSQIYLLQPIINDVQNDKDSRIEETKEGYIVVSEVNYTNETSFTTQKIYFDNDKNLTKVEVLDDEQNIRMCLKVINIEYNINLDKNYFDINQYQKETKDSETKEDVTSNNLDEIVYPMYVPIDTYLAGQDIISTNDGERVISTFNGESQFTLIQENLSSETQTSFIYGDPYIILDTVGAITDSSISWISNGVEYSIISDTMSVDELLSVAQSVSVEPFSK